MFAFRKSRVRSDVELDELTEKIDYEIMKHPHTGLYSVRQDGMPLVLAVTEDGRQRAFTSKDVCPFPCEDYNVQRVRVNRDEAVRIAQEHFAWTRKRLLEERYEFAERVSFSV